MPQLLHHLQLSYNHLRNQPCFVRICHIPCVLFKNLLWSNWFSSSAQKILCIWQLSGKHPHSLKQVNTGLTTLTSGSATRSDYSYVLENIYTHRTIWSRSTEADEKHQIAKKKHYNIRSNTKTLGVAPMRLTVHSTAICQKRNVGLPTFYIWRHRVDRILKHNSITRIPFYKPTWGQARSHGGHSGEVNPILFVPP